MSFRRSDEGLSNYSHFLEVDYLVFIEGQSDGLYWETIFATHRPDLKIEIVQRDGVQNLADVANAIMQGAAKNTLVCRDADYEVLSGTLSHPQVIHTFGYSFENDFLSPAAASLIVSLLSDKPVNKRLIERAFRRYLSYLGRTGDRLLSLDVAYSLVRQNLLARTNPKHLMVEGAGGHLFFSVAEVNSRVRVARAKGPRAKLPQGQLAAFKPLFPRYYCGHSAFFLMMEWCKRIARRLSRAIPNSSNALIKNFLLSHYHVSALGEAQEHMANKLATI